MSLKIDLAFEDVVEGFDPGRVGSGKLGEKTVEVISGGATLMRAAMY